MKGTRGGGFRVAALCILGLSAPLLRAQAPQSFVSLTPCRVVDTRTSAGTFGGPAFAAGESRTYDLPNSSSCSIPSSASAYVLNVTAVPQGPLSYVTVWPAGLTQPNVSTLNSPGGYVIANAAIIPAGTSGGISVYASSATNIIIDINAYFVDQSNANTSTALGTGASNAGTQNTAVGFDSLETNSGAANTAEGAYALAANSTGNNNVAIGGSALLQNSGGSSNTAVGSQALLNDYASDNTALGFNAMMENTLGASNTAAGVSALFNNTSGSYNVAIGQQALLANTTGSYNIAIGYGAGNQASGGNNNIYIANEGLSTDNNLIRIGTGSQTSTYIAGIYNVNVSGPSVLVNANGQLGVASSSRRYKEEIRDLGAASDGLMLLRPVSFRYKPQFANGSQPIQYGLIAEEVAKVYPELVFHGPNGQVESVLYQQLPTLLLNEVQKQHQVMREQENQLQQQKSEIEDLKSRMASLEELLKAHAER